MVLLSSEELQDVFIWIQDDFDVVMQVDFDILEVSKDGDFVKYRIQLNLTDEVKK